MAKKTSPLLHVDSIRHHDRRAYISTEELRDFAADLWLAELAA